MLVGELNPNAGNWDVRDQPFGEEWGWQGCLRILYSGLVRRAGRDRVGWESNPAGTDLALGPIL